MYMKRTAQKQTRTPRSMPVSKESKPWTSYGYLSEVVQRARQDPSQVSEDEWQQLDSAIGTRATGQILAGQPTPRMPEFYGISTQLWGNATEGTAPIQTKLTIGRVGDKYEQEADRVAASVVQQINRGATVSAQEAMEPEQERKPEVGPRISTKGKGSTHKGGEEASTELSGALERERGRGQPLEPRLQSQMGLAMGADFSGVRVHTDSHADRLNRALTSRAFTKGQDIFIKKGEYEPRSREGQMLIAHELTHVSQQREDRTDGKGTKPTIQRDVLKNLKKQKLVVAGEYHKDEEKKWEEEVWKKVLPGTVVKKEQDAIVEPGAEAQGRSEYGDDLYARVLTGYLRAKEALDREYLDEVEGLGLGGGKEEEKESGSRTILERESKGARYELSELMGEVTHVYDMLLSIKNLMKEKEVSQPMYALLSWATELIKRIKQLEEEAEEKRGIWGRMRELREISRWNTQKCEQFIVTSLKYTKSYAVKYMKNKIKELEEIGADVDEPLAVIASMRSAWMYNRLNEIVAKREVGRVIYKVGEYHMEDMQWVMKNIGGNQANWVRVPRLYYNTEVFMRRRWMLNKDQKMKKELPDNYIIELSKMYRMLNKNKRLPRRSVGPHHLAVDYFNIH